MEFSKALEFIGYGGTASVTIEGKTRKYFRKDGKLMCQINNTIYPVKQFYLDAIESKNWSI